LPLRARSPWLLLALVVAAAVAAAVVAATLAASRAGAAPTPPGDDLGGAPAPDFTLTDQYGRTESLSGFRGKVVVLPFIDSRCTTICPLTALVLQQAQDLLGKGAAQVQILAVNTNPLATSVADVNTWSDQHGMNGRWLFLTGSVDQLEPVWRAYGISTQMLDGVDMHTPAVYVIDRQGRERRLLMQGQGESISRSASELAAAVRPLLAR
jgi:cytochrome oxidase Cu insertion factor (SCO1/SenC/PrrC family)